MQEATDSSGCDLDHIVTARVEGFFFFGIEVWRLWAGPEGSWQPLSSDPNTGNWGQSRLTLPQFRKPSLAAERNTIQSQSLKKRGVNTLKHTTSYRRTLLSIFLWFTPTIEGFKINI